MSHHFILILHLIAASIWVGGHIYLVTCLFPGILKRKDNAALTAFEKKYEPLGIPALITLVITGFLMAFDYGIKWADLFSFSTAIERVVSTKLLLLILTVCFALSAQFRVIPSLKKSPKKLVEMAIHATAVTLIGITLLVLGSFVRYGGF